jgi:hypothetical protein
VAVVQPAPTVVEQRTVIDVADGDRPSAAPHPRRALGPSRTRRCPPNLQQVLGR